MVNRYVAWLNTDLYQLTPLTSISADDDYTGCHHLHASFQSIVKKCPYTVCATTRQSLCDVVPMMLEPRFTFVGQVIAPMHHSKR